MASEPRSDLTTEKAKPVCTEDREIQVRCTLRDDGENFLSAATMLATLSLSSSMTVEQLYHEISRNLGMKSSEISIRLSRLDSHGGSMDLSKRKKMTLMQAGFTDIVDNVLLVGPGLNRDGTRRSKLSAEADPCAAGNIERNRSRDDPPFIGLVNQAMTCYLNSLLQTLFMTPEFRNALYRWRFDVDKEEASKSLVFQLQKLFLTLQTSSKPSVETTELTRSFGWDSTEVWQQHDIQELCRVMFDALELKFKGTDQADFITKLYEGRMLDYVKCLECGREKAREDIYQDIQLPIRPFGQSSTYASVEEALRAFVEPEVLSESNQYYCEVCAKKCDAHKGLKFKSFPYLLTLQMKRFEFDYTVMHRIKVNDRVSFPEFWNLNEFLASGSSSSPASTNGGLPQDGDALMSKTSSSSSEDAIVPSSDGKVQDEASTEQSGLCYELFSVMIHSGSASGGHYYAMIKNLETKTWYCFNDTHVTETSWDEVRRMFGGMPDSMTRGYVPGSYNTNAYMLMYRRVEPKLNVGFMKPPEFPSHILALREAIHMQEKEEDARKELERSMLKMVVFYHHQDTGLRGDIKLTVHRTQRLAEFEESAFQILSGMEDISRENCRLTLYDVDDDVACYSFEHLEDDETYSIGKLFEGFLLGSRLSLYMEVKPAMLDFVTLRGEGATVFVHPVNLETGECRAPVRIRVAGDMSVVQLQKRIVMTAYTPDLRARDPDGPLELEVILVQKLPTGNLKRIENVDSKLSDALKHKRVWLFVHLAEKGNGETDVPFEQTRLYHFLNRVSNSIRLRIELPEVDDVVLNRLGLGSDGKPLPQDPLVIPQLPDGSSLSESGPSSQLATSSNGSGWKGETRTVFSGRSRHVFDSSNLTRHSFVGDGDDMMDHDGIPEAPSSSPLSTYGGGDLDLGGQKPGSEWMGIGQFSGPSSNVEELSLQTGGDNSEDSSLNNSERTVVGDPENDGETLSTKGCPGSEVGSNCGSPPPAPYECQISSPEDDPLDTDGVDGEHWDDPNAQASPAVCDIATARDDELLKHIKVDLVSDKVMWIDVDRRITVHGLRRAIAPFLRNIPPSVIRLHRSYSTTHQENAPMACEMRGSETLQCRSDETVIVRLQRQMRENDCVSKVFMFKPVLDVLKDNVYHSKTSPHEKHSELVCSDWVITSGQTAGMVKKNLLPEIRAYTKMDVTLDRVRLRMKMWLDPGPVVFDHQIFVVSARGGPSPPTAPDVVCIHQMWEFMFEILPEPEKATSSTDFLGYLRPWRPAEFKFDPVIEFVIHQPAANVTDFVIAKKIEEMFNIPIEHVEMARPSVCATCLFCERFPAADVDWFRVTEDTVANFMTAVKMGSVTYFRDWREQEKMPSDAELKEMYQEDRVRNLRGGRSSNFVETSSVSPGPTYTPKKEVGLTIYVDGRKPEKKARSDDGDRAN